ncbi:hypothetical protein [Actinomadura sp. NPDC049753]|uniref:hypothetical protein n=1 Tax=Actinomadura sp. NPDC049753 TaxID=3154739 RepID=UPI003440A48E
MSRTKSTRPPRGRALLAALAWLVVGATVLYVPSGRTLLGVNSAFGLITATTGVTALLFLAVLRLPWLRKHADVPRAREIELLASWTNYRKEIFLLALYPAVAGFLLLWAFDAVTVPFIVCVIILYTRTAQTVQSLRRTWRGYHHPVLGVVIGGVFTAAFSPLGLAAIAMSTFPAWQVVIPCVIAGAATFAATMITLWAVPAAEN